MLTRMTEALPLIDVRPAGRVQAIDNLPGLEVIDASGEEFVPSREWLKSLVANDFSPHTLRAYAMSLLRFLRFAWTVDCPWDRVTEREVTEFVLWARETPKFVGNRQFAQVRTGFNLATGKRYQGGRYAPKTINHTLSVVHEFYGYHLDRGVGPIVNPVPAGRSRAGDDDLRGRRRARLRQREQIRTPRMIPDAQFDQLFRRLPSNRDRALVAFYVSSGVRASELLGLTGDVVNLGDQLIGVIRKGGALQWVPASPDAFVWLRLYQLERGVAAAGQPVWLTLRQPQRPMTYDALRAVLGRINQILGSNWTTHDLRHTFAQRALDGGMALHEVQEILGHASLATTSVYTTPHLDDVIAHHRAALSRRQHPEELPSDAYDQAELQSLFERVLP